MIKKWEFHTDYAWSN